MKANKISLILSILLIAFTSGDAQNSEIPMIEKTLNYYLDGGTNNDFETLKMAFHETATMKYINEGYKEVNAIEFFRKGMKPGPKQNRKTRIVSINVAGEAAHAQLEIEYPTFTFVDHMNLLKIDGNWKIVSKIFHKRLKE